MWTSAVKFVVVPVTGVDLRPQGQTVADVTNPNIGQAVTLSQVVKNNGTVATDGTPIEVDFYVDGVFLGTGQTAGGSSLGARLGGNTSTNLGIGGYNNSWVLNTNKNLQAVGAKISRLCVGTDYANGTNFSQLDSVLDDMHNKGLQWMPITMKGGGAHDTGAHIASAIIALWDRYGKPGGAHYLPGLIYKNAFEVWNEIDLDVFW